MLYVKLHVHVCGHILILIFFFKYAYDIQHVKYVCIIHV